jgi:folate-binding protein YgfZ
MDASATVELDAQYRVLRESAGVLPRDGRRVIAVTGPEAAEYLQGQLTNDVEALEPGFGSYAALLDRKGRMQADMRVLRDDDGFVIDTEPETGDVVLRHLSMYKIGRDVEVVDRSDERALISVIGPAAAKIALDGPTGHEHTHRRASLAGAEAVAIATDLGVDLLVAAEDRDRVIADLSERGGEPVSEDAAEIVRVEAGRPRYGREMSASTIPQEAGINERAVSFTKGCYIGQETVARLHYKGKPNRRLVGLRLEGAVVAGDSIRLGERELGTVGTAVLSPARGPIALAIVRREGELGATVEVGNGATAELVELPF